MKNRLLILFQIFVICLSVCGCAPARVDPSADLDIIQTTFPFNSLEMSWQRVDEQNLLLVVENNGKTSVTGFRCGPWFSFAWECQEKQEAAWQTVFCDEGAKPSMILDDLTTIIRPGEKQTFLTNLSYWSSGLKKGETYRMLAHFYEGEISRDQALAAESSAVGVLVYIFQY